MTSSGFSDRRANQWKFRRRRRRRSSTSEARSGSERSSGEPGWECNSERLSEIDK